jgi:hypothetical protein
MSSNSQVLNTGNQAITNYDVNKIFVWNNRFETGNCTNDSYDTYEVGTVMGRVASTRELVPLDSSASDGSQFPVGILAAPINEGEDTTATICVAGDVVESLLIFVNEETLNTVVSAKTLRDRIGSDTVGIKLVGGDELTAYDNQ